MKIDLTDEEGVVLFKDIKNGECFYIGNGEQLFMKIDNAGLTTRKDTRVIAVDNGRLMYLSDDDCKCFVVDCKVVKNN